MKHSTLLSALITFTVLPAFARETPLLAQKAGSSESAPPAPERATVAQSDPRDGARTGFFARGEFGAGYRSFSAQGIDLSVTGAGAGGSILLGGTPVPNLVLLGELSFNSIINPTIQLGDQSRYAREASAGVLGIGPGVIYYFMPANVSLGASFLLSQLTVAQNGVKVGETELGYGGSVRIGKEWWTGRHTALGMNGGFAFATMKDKGEGAPTWLTTAFTLSALLTYQ